MNDPKQLQRVRRLTRSLQRFLDDCEPTITERHSTNVAMLEPAYDYERKRRSTAPSPEILPSKHRTEERMANLTAQLEDMDLGPKVGPHVAVTL
ncbi:hypothetical protein VI817_000199 [Penicillium citrinum]|nr:hypothetical protein VI817_000199 [Penicillium citrinum]